MLCGNLLIACLLLFRFPARLRFLWVGIIWFVVFCGVLGFGADFDSVLVLLMMGWVVSGLNNSFGGLR